MANDNRIDQIQPLPGFPPLVKNIPPNYPNQPSPSKIGLLWKYNQYEIYHKISPYTEGDVPFGILPNKQPFVWRYPGEKNKNVLFELPSKFKSFESRAAPITATQNDVVRIAKWSLSGYGIQFYAKQFFLQAYQPFPETAIYNPLEIILSTLQPMTLGLIDKPVRHLNFGDPSSLLDAVGLSKNSLTGILVRGATGLSGGGVTSLMGGGGKKPLPTNQTGGKFGLIRAPTALRALAELDYKWETGASALVVNPILSRIDTLIPTIIPRKVTGVTYRADENTYNKMGAASSQPADINKLATYNENGAPIATSPAWAATTDKKSNITLSKTYPIGTSAYARFNGPMRIGKPINGQQTGYSVGGGIATFGSVIGQIGSIVSNVFTTLASRYIPFLPISGPAVQSSIKYSSNIGPADGVVNSDMLVNYAEYINDDGTKFISRLSSVNAPAVTGKAVRDMNDGMRRVINGIESNQTYNVNANLNSLLLPSGDPYSEMGYSKIMKFSSPRRFTPGAQYGVNSEYYDTADAPATLDRNFNKKNLKMAASFLSDGINRLGVLEEARSITSKYGMRETYPQWDEWKPYKDDLIAFFFYDVVNKRYIPFRATVKGVSETGTAFWEELRFIGRADELYNYNGFRRTLNFSFNIVVGSITELLPTWQKINYIASAVKPSNYTAITKEGQIYNRFIIPPMFMLTIGDLYKYQPIVLQTVSINIPEDATWETLNERNSKEWSYLNGMITAKNLGKNYAQLPKEIEIVITCNVLEKERAAVGNANFGNAPHTDDGKFFLVNDPYLPAPTEFDKGLLVDNSVDYAKDSGELQVEVSKLSNLRFELPEAFKNVIADIKSSFKIPPLPSIPAIPAVGPTTMGNNLGAPSLDALGKATNLQGVGPQAPSGVVPRSSG